VTTKMLIAGGLAILLAGCDQPATSSAPLQAAASPALVATPVSNTAPAQQGQRFGKSVYSPASGVICDTYGTAYCADGTGISMSYTEQYLGAAAVQKFTRMTSGGSFDSANFVLSNGVQCRVAEKACFKGKNSRTVDRAITRVLFP
jgi:Fels-1 Prophage Protein-like